MKNERIKLFVKETIKKIVAFTFIMLVISAVGQAFAPTISNELALTQMQPSNEMFILMNTYNKIKPIFNTIYIGIIIYFICKITRDTYNFVKDINKEN